jgi:hypothetical protein
MLYFNTLPKISVSDSVGNQIVMTNIMTRSEIIPSLLNNPLLYYKYDIQDSDTPDIIADKYYGDSYRYWLVLMSNQISDPIREWPLTSQQFEAYLNEKYSAAANTVSVLSYTQGTVYQYTKTIKSYDSVSMEETSKTFVIDLPTFTLTQTGTTQQSFSDGSYVRQTIEKSAVSIYEYEDNQNETKRNINLINSKYASQFEANFKSLMSK